MSLPNTIRDYVPVQMAQNKSGCKEGPGPEDQETFTEYPHVLRKQMRDVLWETG